MKPTRGWKESYYTTNNNGPRILIDVTRSWFPYETIKLTLWNFDNGYRGSTWINKSSTLNHSCIKCSHLNFLQRVYIYIYRIQNDVTSMMISKLIDVWNPVFTHNNDCSNWYRILKRECIFSVLHCNFFHPPLIDRVGIMLIPDSTFRWNLKNSLIEEYQLFQPNKFRIISDIFLLFFLCHCLFLSFTLTS